MKKLKVFVIGTRGFPHVQGGVEQHCQALYPRLAKAGCDIIVATRKPYIAPDTRLADWKGVRFIHLWCPKRKSLEAIVHSTLALFHARQHAPDLVHFHAVGPAILIPLAKILGLKVVMTHHGPDYERAKWGRLAKSVLQLGEYLGTKWSDHIIVISQTINQLLCSRYRRSDQTLIPNGVDLPEKVPPGPTLRQFDLQKNRYVLAVSRLVPEKGLHDLIDAYRTLENPDFKLVIAGSADHQTAYSRNLVQTVQETPGVVLTGFQTGNSLAELYSNAGLFVLPSYYEGLPIALLEALSFDLSVLVSDIPQHKEIDLPPDRYFPVGNVTVLADQLVRHTAGGISQGEATHQRQLIQTLYNWDRIADQTLAVYKSVGEVA